MRTTRRRRRRAVPLPRTAIATLAGALTWALPWHEAASQQPTPGAFAEEVRERLTDWSARWGRMGRPVERQALERLYEPPPSRPLWSVEGHPTSQALGVIEALAGTAAQGLRPVDYEVDSVRGYVEALAAGGGDQVSKVAGFDLTVSSALVRMLTDLRFGRVDLAAVGIDPPGDRAPFDVSALVLEVSRGADVRSAITVAEPRYAGYAALSRLLARYRALAADSVFRPPARSLRSLRPGDPYPDAPSLRRYLAALGDLSLEDTVVHDTTRAHLYDSALAAAVVAFQRRHGLEPDSALGPASFAALRVSPAERIRQIEVTMERWRWLPDQPPRRYAVVNIPGFRLYAFENDTLARSPAVSANVIVGEARSRHYTPLFTGTMQEVVFRPYWEVPPRIARNELVPLIRRKPAYFDAEGFEIVRGDGRSVTYPPTAANLSRVAAGMLKLRQRPGPKNALGLIKFVFPNRYNVYLHDTPTKALFDRGRRDFSHGCMRLQNPAEFAEFVLRGQAGWERAAIDSAMHGTRTLRVRIERPVVVYVVYATVGVDESGIAYFYPDVYAHDRPVAKLLEASPVSAPTAAAPRP